MKKFLLWYKRTITRNVSGSENSKDGNLIYWQGKLFCSFLIYCLPVSLIALIPGVYMAVKENLFTLAIIDLGCFVLVTLAAFLPYLSLRVRKVLIVTVFYFLAFFLINALGYLGPGVFYLFFITILSALIFQIRYAYLSVVLNAFVLVLFALIINFKLFNSALISEYTVGKWLAFSSNLLFASTIIVLLIDKIFYRLQFTISNKTSLQQRYQLIFDKSPLPTWLFDTDSYQFLDVNDAALRQYGYTREEFLSMTIMDIRYAQDVPQTVELVRANKISGEFYGGTSQHIKKDGEMLFVKIESNLLHLDGKSVRLVQATDITTQVQHQLEVFDINQKIKESESNLRAIFDSAIDGFVLVDAKGIIKLFNPKASSAMRFNKNQTPFEIGSDIYNYVETSRLIYFKEVMARVYSGETVDYDRMFRTNGVVSWIRYTLTPVIEEERVIGACITGRDVTAKKLYLRSVEEQNKVFREISWMQSHLVRAPLARITGLLPMLNDNADAEETAQIINYLNVSAIELDNIVKQIIEKSSSIIEKYPEQQELE